MEFAYLGSHCSIGTCGQHDYLPFQCDACNRTFCKDHRAYSDHSCSFIPMGEEVVKCLICGKGITRLPGIDINLTISQHMDSSECKKEEIPKCPKCKTRLTDINTITCIRCKQKVCVSHRYSDQHECSHPLERRINALGFKCTKCCLGFAGSLELIQHMRSCH